jgi:hypothetical protein
MRLLEACTLVGLERGEVLVLRLEVLQRRLEPPTLGL